MKILAFGKIKNSPYSELSQEYLKRFRGKVELKELAVGKGSKTEIMQAEAKILQAALPQNSFKIFLEVTGKEFTSTALANYVQQKKQQQQDLVFVLGGAYGFSEEALALADLKLSLSKLTLPHMLARIILLEQLYRAETINNNHPYHK